MSGTDTKVDVAAIGKLAWEIIKDGAATAHFGDSDAVAVIPRGAERDDIKGHKQRRHMSFNCEWETKSGSKSTCLIHVSWEYGGTFQGHGAYVRDALVYASDIEVGYAFTMDGTTNFFGPDVDDNGVANLKFHIRVEGGNALRRSTYDYVGTLYGDGNHTWEQFDM